MWSSFSATAVRPCVCLLLILGLFLSDTKSFFFFFFFLRFFVFVSVCRNGPPIRKKQKRKDKKRKYIPRSPASLNWQFEKEILAFHFFLFLFLVPGCFRWVQQRDRTQSLVSFFPFFFLPYQSDRVIKSWCGRVCVCVRLFLSILFSSGTTFSTLCSTHVASAQRKTEI